MYAAVIYRSSDLAEEEVGKVMGIRMEKLPGEMSLTELAEYGVRELGKYRRKELAMRSIAWRSFGGQSF
ncbi:MAG: hypothetical protein IMW89_04660 [Ktedonobacteraceae bacterium]|nr:hypothetical protein [Ktedonobacteraceae bacterium]